MRGNLYKHPKNRYPNELVEAQQEPIPGTSESGPFEDITPSGKSDSRRAQLNLRVR
jgi:hypothetical protein